MATATALVARMDALYAIERQLKESQAEETTRPQVRIERTLPLFDQLMSELNTAALDEKVLHGGALVKACRYALNLWGAIGL
ncbi:MAG: transposase [Verrucomicrobiota bacterium]